MPTRPSPRSRLLRSASRHLIPALVAAIFLLPLLQMVVGSLRPIGAPPPQGIEFLPPQPTLESFRRLGDFLPVQTFLRNSLFVSAVAVPLTVLVASLAGFGIRLLPTSTARVVVVATVVAMLIPVTAVWATRFQLFRWLGVTDTYLPLVAPALVAANPFYVLIYAWAFAHVPDDQLDAARLDGTGATALWWRVALPQVRPATLAVVVLAFAFHWSNFIDALLYLDLIERFTYPLGLRFLQQLNPTEWPLLMAGALLFTVPVVAVLLLAQRVLFEDPRRIVQRQAP